MSGFQQMIGLLLVMLSLNSQAGLTDLFCIQNESSCVETPSIADVSPQPVQPLSTTALSNENMCVDVKGVASTNGVDDSFARKMAIRDALKMASLHNNVNVKTDQSVDQYQVTLDSSRFTSSSKVKGFTVLTEGLEDPYDMYGQTKKGPLNYEVTLNVCLTEDRSVCTDLTGNQYQTRLAVAPVVIAHGNQANDVSNLLMGYQQELERRIKLQGYRNFSLLLEPVDLQPNIIVEPNLDPELLSGIRDRTGAQYLLLTVIRSLSAHQNDGYLNGAKRFYNLEVKPDSRHIEVDWYVLDLMKNRTVHQMRQGFDLQGDVTVGRDRPFGSNAFFATDTGMAFHALLEKQTTDVLDFLHCKPFESQIIDVRNNEYIVYLNSASGAKVGDDLAVYHKTGRPVRINGVNLGTDEVPGAFLKIKRILPKFAIAEVTAKKGIVQVGDLVKAW
jgi:hypothetical protein